MEPSVYRHMAATEDRHWWFRGRRTLVRRALERAHLPARATLLEIGCGSGGNLPMLARFGAVTAIEPDDWAREQASARLEGLSGARVLAGAVPDALPPGLGPFDAVVMTDVVEHTDDDVASLAAVRRIMAPGALLVLTVPAMPWLWSSHDVMHHHRRRYTERAIAAACRAAGFRDLATTYANTALFPALAFARLTRGMQQLSEASQRIPPEPLNRLLAALFGAERHLLGRVRLPFGSSLLVTARR